jgi:NADP-dependent 3-hydroxy acid dehydrogenase YdfG
MKGSVAVVTGASSGIGGRSPLRSQRGAKVVLAARRKERLDVRPSDRRAGGKPPCHVREDCEQLTSLPRS